MRRKAQILEYNASATNTKTNNLTRAERWAQLVAGKTQQRNLPYSYINKNLIDITTGYVQTCPSGTILYTPTSSSGVPGPIMNLYYDPTVPLYMYSSKTNNPALVNQLENVDQFTYDNDLTKKDNYLNQSNSIVLTSIYIYNMLTTTYSFNIDFPISFFIQATLIPGKTGHFHEQINLNFNVSNVLRPPYRPFQPHVYYGKSELNTNIFNSPCQIYSPGDPSQPGLQSVTFDISMNVDYSNSNQNSFYGNQYIGNYSMYNLILETQKGIVYDICLNGIDLNRNKLVNYAFQSVDTKFYDYFENFSYGICANVAYNTANTFHNCVALDTFDKTAYKNKFNLNVK
jgi:hypothetical protein